MSIGKRLREERERLGLSQADFAEKTGVGRNTIVRYETGKTRPGTGFIEAIRALGVEVDYVLFGTRDVYVECPYLRLKGKEDLVSLDMCRRLAATTWYQEGETEGLAPEEFKICRECAHNPMKKGLARKEGGSLLDDFAYENLGKAFISAIDIAPDVLERSLIEISHNMEPHNATLEQSGLVNYEKWKRALEAEYLRAVQEVLRTSPKLTDATRPELDFDLLRSVVREVDAAAFGIASINSEKKAQVVTMLYRAFKASGKVDPAMIDEAVRLAAT